MEKRLAGREQRLAHPREVVAREVRVHHRRARLPHERPGVVLPVVAAVQVRMPERMHVVSPAERLAPETYRVADYRATSKGVYTHNPPAGAFRGFGVTQSAYAVESNMDILAHELGMDPFELRRKNALQTAVSWLIAGQTNVWKVWDLKQEIRDTYRDLAPLSIPELKEIIGALILAARRQLTPAKKITKSPAAQTSSAVPRSG